MGTELVSFRERLVADATAAAAREQRSSAMLSLQGGVFAIGGQTLGSRIIAVVLDSYFANEFYDPSKPYDPEDPQPPVCYAFARDGKHEMRPHESMQADLTFFKPQSPWDMNVNAPGLCSGCVQNKWGSQPGRKGKACKNRETLTLLPAGFFQPPKSRGGTSEPTLFDDPAHFAKADAVGLKLPVTSGANWAAYVTQLAASHRLPPYGVYTEIYLENDPKSQYKVKFDMLGELPESLFEIVMRKVDGVISTPFKGYEPPEKAPF